MTMIGTWKVRERGTTDTIAHVRVDPDDHVFWRPLGVGERKEKYEALELLLGDASD